MWALWLTLTQYTSEQCIETIKGQCHIWGIHKTLVPEWRGLFLTHSWQSDPHCSTVSSSGAPVHEQPWSVPPAPTLRDIDSYGTKLGWGGNRSGPGMLVSCWIWQNLSTLHKFPETQYTKWPIQAISSMSLLFLFKYPKNPDNDHPKAPDLRSTVYKTLQGAIF